MRAKQQHKAELNRRAQIWGQTSKPNTENKNNCIEKTILSRNEIKRNKSERTFNGFKATECFPAFHAVPLLFLFFLLLLLFGVAVSNQNLLFSRPLVRARIILTILIEIPMHSMNKRTNERER